LPAIAKLGYVFAISLFAGDKVASLKSRGLEEKLETRHLVSYF